MMQGKAKGTGLEKKVMAKGINKKNKTKGENRTNNMCYYPFVSTGKEKDVETGYGYFGARYIDQDLTTLFLSVDPMADKYPSINPYAYCMWNPIKLVDPDGMDVVLSKSAKAIHDKYYGKKGYEEYTALFDNLNNDHSVLFIVKECNDNLFAKNQGANGIINYSDADLSQYPNGCFEIEWGDSGNYHGGTREHVYMEELCHAGQIVSNNYNLNCASIDNEYLAKVFAIRNSKDYIKSTYDDLMIGGYEIPTEFSIIKDYDVTDAKRYLKEGLDVYIKRIDNSYYNQKIGGMYHELPW